MIHYEELVPAITSEVMPEEWFEFPGDWDDLGAMGLHMMFSEPWEYVTVFPTIRCK